MDQPPERTPAPGDLSLVQAFVNSTDLEADQDDLADVEGASAWLSSRDGGEFELDEPGRRRLVEVREALRDVLAVHTGEAEGAAAAARLTGMFRGALLRPVVNVDGVGLVPACEGVDVFLAGLGWAIAEATAAGTWNRLKVCRDDTCRWAFYDHSKNGRGAWCTMRVCGNRAKARAYRERQRTAVG